MLQELKDRKIPFISEVEEFNRTFGKPNNYHPHIPEDSGAWKFVYNFIAEELEEYKEACEAGDVVGTLDAFCDLLYVVNNGIMLHGFKGTIEDAYAEVQASNMSKSCTTEEEAKQTVEVREVEQKCPCHYEKVDDVYVVYRTHDYKVMKSINYFKPNLKQFINAD